MSQENPPKPLFSYRKYWAECFGPAPYLPMSRDEMDQLGWDATPMIALGDAQNDAAMIQAADVGVWIKAAGRPPPVARARHHTFHTTQSAPTGWTEGIHAALAACHGDMPAPVSQPASHIT